MRKVISVILMTVLLISLSGISVVASGSRERGNGNCARRQQDTVSQEAQQPERQMRLEVCTFEDCNNRGIHEHDGVYFRCSYYPCDYCTGFRECLGRGGRGLSRNRRGSGRRVGLCEGLCPFR